MIGLYFWLGKYRICPMILVKIGSLESESRDIWRDMNIDCLRVIPGSSDSRVIPDSFQIIQLLIVLHFCKLRVIFMRLIYGVIFLVMDSRHKWKVAAIVIFVSLQIIPIDSFLIARHVSCHFKLVFYLQLVIKHIPVVILLCPILLPVHLMVILLVELLIPLPILALLHIVLIEPFLVLPLRLHLVLQILLLLRDVLVSQRLLVVLISGVLTQVLVLVGSKFHLVVVVVSLTRQVNVFAILFLHFSLVRFDFHLLV